MRPKLATVPRERGSKTSTVKNFPEAQGKESGQIQLGTGSENVPKSIGPRIAISGGIVSALAAADAVENEEQKRA